MENPYREIVLYTGDPEAVLVVVAAPGHRENAIEVENAPDFHQVHEHFGPVGSPLLRRSRRTRHTESLAPSSSNLPPKKQKGLGSFPISVDYDAEDDVPLSKFFPQSRRTSRSAATPMSSTIPAAETPVPPTAMETDPSNPNPAVPQSLSSNLDPVAAHTSSLPPDSTLGSDHSSSNDADFVPGPSVSSSESESATAFDAIPDPHSPVHSPPPTRSTPTARSIPSAHRGKAHSSQFVTLAAKVRWEKLSVRNLLDERNISLTAFDEVNLLGLLRERSLFKSVTHAVPYVREIVFEFYSNLENAIKDPNSPTYHQVYLRGKMFEFSPSVLNSFLDVPTVEVDVPINDFNEVAQVLTAGQLQRWPTHPYKLLSSHLTSLSATLHKVAITNWIPTSNNLIVTREQDTLIFKLTQGLPFDLGSLIFNQITKYAETTTHTVGLPFPSLIYQVLVLQGLRKKMTESVSPPTSVITISHFLLKGTRLKDLPYVSSQRSSQASSSASSSSIQALFISYLQAELRSLEAEQTGVTSKIRHVKELLLSAQKRGDGTTRTHAATSRTPLDGEEEDPEEEPVAAPADQA